MQTEHEQNASSTLNVLSFARFVRNSVGAEFGQTPGIDRRNSTQRLKNQTSKQKSQQPKKKSPAEAEVCDYQIK